MEYFKTNKYYGGKHFSNLYEIMIGNTNSSFKWLSFDFRNIFRRTINYSTLTYAYSYHLIFSPSIIFSQNLTFFTNFERYFLYKTPWRFKIYDETTFRLGILCHFTSLLRFRLITQFYTYTKSLVFSPLFSYEPSPFTVFYFGANLNTIKYRFKLEGESYQIFLKFQYVFNI